MTAMRRLLCLAALAVAALTLSAQQQFPALERGFHPERLYQFSDFDAVNVFNGNLTIALPIGSEYPLNGGLSYKLVLSYNSNVWDFEQVGGGKTHAHPSTRSNAGLGWLIGMGRFLPGNDPKNYSESDVYESPDGADHRFGPPWSWLVGADPDAGCIAPCPLRASDGTNFRLKRPDDTTATVESPDGTTSEFAKVGGEWQLQQITHVNTADAVTIDTTPGPTADCPAASLAWTITDSRQRSHSVCFKNLTVDGVNRPMVTAVIVAAPNGQRARYAFTYVYAERVPKPSQDTDNNDISWRQQHDVRQLDSLLLPDGSSYHFDYQGLAGTLSEVTFPTGGKVQYTYGNWTIPAIDICDNAPSAGFGFGNGSQGVVGRIFTPASFDTSSAQQTWSYARELSPAFDSVMKCTVGLGPGSDPGFLTVPLHDEMVVTVTDPLGNKVKSHYSFYPGNDTGQADPDTSPGGIQRVNYGMPYGRYDAAQDRYLSQEIFECDPTCSLKRSVWVRHDVRPDSPLPYLEITRLASKRTVFHDDPAGCTAEGANATCKWTESDSTLWDDYGHYRVVKSRGNLGGSVVERTETTDWNMSDGVHRLIDRSMNWVLNTYEKVQSTSDGHTVTQHACFDTDTGFLLRKRLERRSNVYQDPTEPAVPDQQDLLTVFTREAGTGNLTEEAFYGGKGNLLPAGFETCSDSPGTPRYKLVHHYGTPGTGVRESTTYTGTGFKVFDATPDPKTGFPVSSRDTAGVETTYGYNPSGQITRVTPAGTAQVNYGYETATSSTPARATATSGSGLTQTTYHYDSFGRLTQVSERMPDFWSTTWTTYDALGRKASVTTPQETPTGDAQPRPSDPDVTTWEYDAFGRPLKITTPDGKSTLFSYVGIRETTRTASVGTGEEGETAVATKETMDSFGRLVKVTENGSVETQYQYDSGNRLTKVTMPGTPGQVRTFTYDDAGFLASEDHPESGFTQYAYDARGHAVLKKSPLASDALTYTYDAAERLTAVTGTAGVIKEFTYDRQNVPNTDYSMGKVSTAARHNRPPGFGDVIVTESFKYGGKGGRISEKTTTVSGSGFDQEFTDKYGYDDLGAIDSITYPSCANCGGLASLSRTVTAIRQFGLITQVGNYTAPNGITYHPDGLLAQIQHRNSDGTNGPLYVQESAHGMGRPASIAVSNYCASVGTITISPVAATNATPGSTVTLTASASGSVASWQWFEKTDSGDVLLTGKTSNVLSVTVAGNHSYFARAYGDTCNVYSVIVPVTSCGTPAIAAVETITASTTSTASVPTVEGAEYYLWSIAGGTIVDGAAAPTVTFTAGCSGTVSLTLTMKTACGVASATRQIPIDPPTASVSGSRVITGTETADLTVHLSGLGPWSLVWSDGTPETANASPHVRVGLQPSTTTTYSLTAVSDVNGCQGTPYGSATITVTTPNCTPPSAAIDTDTEYYSSKAEIAEVPYDATHTYVWTVTNGKLISGAGENRISVRPGCAGAVTIKVTVTAACGAKTVGTKTVPIVPPTARIEPPNSATRQFTEGGADVDITAIVNAYKPTVTWSDGYRQTVDLRGQNPATRAVHPAVTTAYSVVDIRDTYGCPGQTLGSVTVTVCKKAVVTLSAPSSMVSSETKIASVQPVANATYAWTVTNGTLVSGNGTPNMTFRASCTLPVDVRVVVTSSCGASTQKDVTIPVQRLTGTATGTATIVQGSSATFGATLTGVGPWTVAWGDRPAESASTSPVSRLEIPPVTTTYTLTSVTDFYGCTATLPSSAVVITVRPPAPAAVNAVATSSTQVSVSWTFSGTADRFDVYRNGLKIGMPTASPYSDTTAQPATAYLYHVVAVKAGAESVSSARDLATTVIFVDDPLEEGMTLVTTTHVMQARAAVNAVRRAASLPDKVFTDASLSGLMPKALHVSELRQGLDEARAALGLSPMSYSRPMIPGLFIFTQDIMEIRAGVR